MYLITSCILILLAASCQSEKFIRHKTDTILKFEAEPAPSYDPCACKGSTCSPKKTAEAEVCGEILHHLRQHLQPMPLFFRCHMGAKMCTDSKSKKLHFELLFDQDEMTHQPFYQGDDLISVLVSGLLKRRNIEKYKYVNKDTIKITADIGISGSPVVMEGILNIEKTLGHEVMECRKESCPELVNKLCKDSGEQFKIKIPKLESVLLGCRVSRIYEIEGAFHVTYALLIDYPKALASKLFKDEADLRQKFNEAIRDMPTPRVLKIHILAGATLKSYCEYEAKSVSNALYSDKLEDPSSGYATLSAIEARSKLAEQVILGQKDQHYCLGDITKVAMSKNNQMTEYQLRLAFSNACLTEHKKISSCKQYTENLQAEWKRGDSIRHFDKFPKFDFKVLTA